MMVVSAYFILLLALIAANLPFMTERIFLLGPKRAPKALAWRLLELLLLWALTLAIGSALEAHLGQRHSQNWEFFVAFGFLFLTLAFPGFVWRYLRKSRAQPLVSAQSLKDLP
jgi:Protein of unknown function (DUF2818)